MSGGGPSVRALTPGWRAVRIALLGGSSLFLAATAHAAGGGVVPSAGVLAVLALLLGLAAVPLTVRRCRLRLLLPVLAVEQLGVHLALTAAAGPAHCLQGGPAGGTHHLLLSGCTLDGSVGTTAGSVSASATMLVGHLVAVAATAWLLARGEAWLWRAADQIAASTARLLADVGVAPAVAVVAVGAVPGRWRPIAPLPPRGPPCCGTTSS